MIVDFLIKFQLLLCSNRNKDNISKNEHIYVETIKEFLDKSYDISIRMTSKSSAVQDLESMAFIDLNHEFIFSPEDAERYMDHFVNILYHEIGHPFAKKFKLKDYDSIYHSFQYAREGFHIFFPKYTHVQDSFYKDFFKKFYNLDILHFSIGEDMWKTIAKYLDDFYYRRLFGINFTKVTEEEYNFYVEDFFIGCDEEGLEPEDCGEPPTMSDVQKDQDEDNINKLIDISKDLKIEYSKESIIPKEISEFKNILKVLKSDKMVNNNLLTMMSPGNIEHVSDSGHLSMMTRELYSFADRKATSVNEEEYEKIFKKLLSLEYPKNNYLNNFDLMRAVMLFYGSPEENSKALLKFLDLLN